MFNNSFLLRNLITLGILVALYSCAKKTEEATTDTPATPAFEYERKAFFNSLLAPSEASAKLQSTGANFDGTLLNDPNNYVNYANNDVKAASNLGIYLADLNYCIAFNQPDQTKALFPAVHALSKSVGIEQGILDFLMNRYQKNLEKNDSVKAVFLDLYNSATKDVEGSAREKLVGIAMSTYQIENLHLTLGLIRSFPKDILPADSRNLALFPLFRLVLEQRNSIAITYGFLKSITDVSNPDQNPNYPFYAQAFEELIGVYKRLNVEEMMANSKGSELLNDPVVAELSNKVDAIRSKIVSLE